MHVQILVMIYVKYLLMYIKSKMQLCPPLQDVALKVCIRISAGCPLFIHCAGCWSDLNADLCSGTPAAVFYNFSGRVC